MLRIPCVTGAKPNVPARARYHKGKGTRPFVSFAHLFVCLFVSLLLRSLAWLAGWLFVSLFGGYFVCVRWFR
jgi:hypothetical protein